ncbi:hypothetical protein Dimus_033590 [Dionaea muscipula]
MRFNFDISETEKPIEPPKSPTPPTQLEWFPLQDHPVFAATPAAQPLPGGGLNGGRMARNLLAWDGASRLYYWDTNEQCLHRISIRLGEPDEHSVIAAYPSKVLKTDMELEFVVNKISVNRNGSAVVLAGSNGLCIMNLFGHTSTKGGSVVCRTMLVGPNVYFKAIRILQVTWHPYSNVHVGVLSSDSVFRIFDLSSAVEKPEQEYYLQPMEPGSKFQKAASICAADFTFGSDHLWDKFSVFILFADGSVYILCPVVPFGCAYMWESVMEMHADAQALGLKSANQTAIKNSNRALSWLESTFPELKRQGQKVEGFSVVMAHAYALIDASLLLQGPLCKICSREDDIGADVAECKGRALNLVYSSIGKDSILVMAWSSGQLQIDALADEIQPVWRMGSPPRLCVDSQDQILGFAMICESLSGQLPVVRLDKPLDNNDWLGHPPPLLRLAIVDLALPTGDGSDFPVSLYIDPLNRMKIFAVHDGGVDSIVLHFLPFTSHSGKNDTMSAPSVDPILSTCQGMSNSTSYVCGFVVLTDSYGYSWIAGVTSTHGSFVLEMKFWDVNLPTLFDMIEITTSVEEPTGMNTPFVLSKEILNGPKTVIIPQASLNLRSTRADSIEGRSTVHQYLNLFHENYMEYAHKVYVELMHHLPYMKKKIHDLHVRLYEVQQKLSNIEEKEPKIKERMQCALLFHSSLEERLRRLRSLPGMHKRPLYRAELEFKKELDRFSGAELDALHSLIQTLNARLWRFSQSSKSNVYNLQRRPSLKSSYAQDAQLDLLKAALQKLSLVNSENSKKVKMVESVIKKMEDES